MKLNEISRVDQESPGSSFALARIITSQVPIVIAAYMNIF